MTLELNKWLTKENTIDPIVSRDIIESINLKLEENVLYNFEGNFLEITYSSAVTDEPYKHGLNFVPKDVIMLSSNPSTVTVSFKYEDFDINNIYITTSGAVLIRIIVGNYRSN